MHMLTQLMFKKVVDTLEGDEKTGAKIILKGSGSSAVPHCQQTQVWKALLS